MNVQAAPSPYTPVGAPNMANAPTLGAPVPGTTGGLPALSGLSVTQNPAAQQLQSMGRGDDTMLVHMTPEEVNSLQGLAMAAGGSLTINPQTGLPEAGFLKKLLPMLAGIGLNFILPGSGVVATLGGKAATAGLMVGAGTTALTGDLSKGLMAGLGAFGGASLAGGVEGALASGAKTGATTGATTGAATGATGATGATATVPGAVPGMVGTQIPASMLTDVAGQGINLAPSAAKTLATTAAKTPGTGFLSQFGQAAKGTMTGLGAKVAPMAAGMGVLNTVSEATAPQMPKYDPNAEDDFEYVPMGPGKREVRFQTPEQMRESGGAEFQYFTPTNPAPMPLSEQPRRFAEGGLAAVPPQGFEDLVSFFNATNPGAITASMYPTSPAPSAAASAAPASGGEVVHNFTRPTSNIPSGSTGAGTNPYGTFGIPDFSGVDINAILSGMGYVPAVQPNQPGQPTTPIGDTQNMFGDLGLTLGDIVEYQNTPGRGPSAAPVMPAPIMPAPTTPSQADGYNALADLGLSMGDIMEQRGTPGRGTTGAPTYDRNDILPFLPPMDSAPAAPAPVMPAPIMPAPTPAPSVRPSAPPTMMPQPENSPMPEVVSFEDIMATYTPPPAQPVYRAPEPEPMPIRTGRSGRRNPEVEQIERARGGVVNIRDGAFVVDARTVSELGNGSSNAGIEMLSRMGGRPVRGPGDGVSDSVRASIGGKQEARVARDEVIFSPEAVRRLGGGNEAKGTKKLYALMDKAHKARKKAKRGQDTKVRKGLA